MISIKPSPRVDEYIQIYTVEGKMGGNKKKYAPEAARRPSDPCRENIDLWSVLRQVPIMARSNSDSVFCDGYLYRVEWLRMSFQTECTRKCSLFGDNFEVTESFKMLLKVGDSNLVFVLVPVEVNTELFIIQMFISPSIFSASSNSIPDVTSKTAFLITALFYILKKKISTEISLN